MTQSSTSFAGEGTPGVPSPAKLSSGRPSPPQGARRRWAPPRSWSRRRRLTIIALGLVLALVALICTDLAVLSHRPQRVEVALPQPGPQASGSPGQTWLILGLDSRETVPAGPNHYGTTAEVEGSRADIIALVQPGDEGLSVLTLPRELTARGPGGELERLAASHLRGPQYTVDLLCGSLGVTTTHLVTIDMAQFAAIIDSLGGLEVEIPEPVRDSYSGLDLSRAGRQRLDGVQALALVRSRHPEILREGAWTPLGETEGNKYRSESTSMVMTAMLSAMSDGAANPWTMRTRIHRIASHLSLDESTGALDLLSLARSASRARSSGALTVEGLPLPTQEGSVMAFPDERSHEVLAQHGYTPGACTPAAP
ncbi:LCP family protein [Actinomyces bowdenii]|uniref:LCP family protein n=1 Tax=Actinomyces bowdenii TaxID=131109 RepID=UPI001ABCE02E|nr:LCP family protein [Actinomyces bowdenii]MBO3725787.1 LCP family protein [Actinomyces bowdenii]